VYAEGIRSLLCGAKRRALRSCCEGFAAHCGGRWQKANARGTAQKKNKLGAGALRWLRLLPKGACGV